MQGSHNIVYEVAGVSFEKNGVKEWVPIVVTNKGKESVSSPHQLLDELIHG